jgi:hypothetical protein
MQSGFDQFAEHFGWHARFAGATLADWRVALLTIPANRLVGRPLEWNSIDNAVTTGTPDMGACERIDVSRPAGSLIECREYSESLTHSQHGP